MCKKDVKIVLELVESSDLVGIKDIQKKLNQWNTIGTLIDTKVIPSSQSFLFKIILKK